MKLTFANRLARRLFALSSGRVWRRKPQESHQIPTVLSSTRSSGASDFLLELATQAASSACDIELDIGNKENSDYPLFNIFPGEHYRLLAALANALKAKKIVEVGTFTGMGSLALLAGSQDSELITFDVLPWDDPSFATHLRAEDFKANGGRVSQEIADLADLSVFERYRNVLEEADMIFLDGPKNDLFEYAFARNLSLLENHKKRLLVVDDIHFVNMIDLWQSVRSPKLDLTSFGHFSGTGLIDLSEGFSSGI